MKQMRRLLSAALSLLLCLALPAAALAAQAEPDTEAEAAPIRSLADFLAFSEGCAVEGYSAGKRFSLETDLDLSGTLFQPVPYFAGVFEGNGHLILGLELTADGSRQGLFRTVAEGAQIHDLNVRGTVAPGGSGRYVGGVAGVNLGLLDSCSFDGRVAGVDAVGGIAGQNAGTVRGCTFRGEVLGEHRVGGVAGENGGTLSECVNEGAVNTEAVTPRGEQSFDLASLSEEDFLDLADLGGIAGANAGVIAGCRNRGPVGYKYTGYNVGGIAGRSSGYVTECENYGAVTGRRDVGGIVGQLIPYAAWDVGPDRMAALGGAIGGMNSILTKMSEHTQARSDQVRGELENMNGYTRQALSALSGVMEQVANDDRRLIDSVTVDPVTGEVSFDRNALSWVDLSALTAALGNMQAQSSVLAGLAAEATGQLAEDLRQIGAQMSYVMNAVNAAVGSALDVSVEREDLSAAESYDHDIGAVDACFNYGGVEAENNAGGVVGAMDFELEFDRENLLGVGDVLSGNLKQKLFAVLRGCGSFGEVRTRGDCAGCLAGEIVTGAAVDSFGSGTAASQSGDYVGGAVGRSAGCVKSCWVRCVLSGGRYVGGVAGLGTDILDCRSWTHIEQGAEYLGAVAGWADGTVSGNLYAESLPAGVDGVSRTDQTTPLPAKELLALEDVPEDFELLHVRFEVEGELYETVEVPFGGSIETLPQVPNREEKYWKWDDFDAEHIYYSMRIQGKYYAPGSVISSGGEVPKFLVEGRFYEGQELRTAEFNSGWEPAEEELEAATVYVAGYEGELTVRMLSGEDGAVYLAGGDGSFERISCSRDGQYVVFTLPNGASFVYVRADAQRDILPWAVGGGAAVLVLCGGIWLIARRKTRKKAAVEAAADAENPGA